MTTNVKQFMKGMLIAYLVKHLDSLVLVGVGMQIDPDIEIVNTLMKMRII